MKWLLLIFCITGLMHATERSQGLTPGDTTALEGISRRIAPYLNVDDLTRFVRATGERDTLAKNASGTLERRKNPFTSPRN